MICSNVKCKSWNQIRKLSANFDYSQIKQGQGLTPDDPIIVNCPKCNNMGKISYSGVNNLGSCHHCNVSFIFLYEINKWYKDQFGSKIFTTRYYGVKEGMDWNNGFVE